MQETIGAVEALDRQMTFLPPDEEPEYARLKTQLPLHYLRSAKLRLEFAREALGAVVEDVAALGEPAGGATPLMEEFARRNIPFLVTTGLDASVPAGVRILPKPYRDAEFIDAILELVHRKQ